MSIFNWKKKPKEEAPTAIETIANESQMLFARFLFEDEPNLDDSLIEAQLAEKFESFESAPRENDETRLYFLKDYIAEFKEGAINPSCTIFKPKDYSFIEQHIGKAFQQLWHWPEAEQVVQSCKFELVLTDLLTRTLDYKSRAILFQKFVTAVAIALKPKAIYFPTSEKLVETTSYLQEVDYFNGDFLNGLLNIRLFNLENSNDILMDGLGLYTLGLPDFEIVFSGHDPSEVAGLLHSYSHYIYQYGSVIKDGNTVEGIAEGSKWRCNFSESLLEPKRFVIKITEE